MLSMILFAAPPAAADPRRIVSTNLCTDQLVLALADRGQIAGLTANAADPAMSAEAARARGLHRMRSAGEEMLGLAPDLIVGMPVRRDGALAALDPRGTRLLDLADAATYPQIVANIGIVARAVGHPERGAALVARMDAALAAIGRPGRGRIAAHYQRRGYLTGTGTLVDDLMARLGLVNLARRLGRPPLARLSLEEMVAARPDLLIVERATAHVADQGSEMLHHPVLDAIPRLAIPEAWTVCGGPAYVRAAASLARQLGGRPFPR